MSAIVVSELEYAPPGADSLFFGLNFRVGSGQHAALVGENGVGKSTLLRILAGRIEDAEGALNVASDLLYMSQDVGLDEGHTVWEMLLALAPEHLRLVGEVIRAAEERLETGDTEAGVDLAMAFEDWGRLGGYALEARWDVSARAITGRSLDDLAGLTSSQLSGGERKRIVLDYLFASDASTLLMDEPDNYLDIPAKQELEQRIRDSRKTILMVSHDRDLLSNAADMIITLEPTCSWVFGGSYAGYSEAREQRQKQFGDALRQWHDEERRLYRHYRLMKQRAAVNYKNAPKGDAAENRWKRFVAVGSPPAPPSDQNVVVRLRGERSGRKVVSVDGLAVRGVLRPISLEITYGERVAIVGPNGTGKTTFLRGLLGLQTVDEGAVRLGANVSPGYFSQFNIRSDFGQAPLIRIVSDIVGGREQSMKALARYGLQNSANRGYDTLSGGQKARFEILVLELNGHNLLLLDEPTDNLDVDSSEALEDALEEFNGTVIAVSHDRAFLRKLERFIMINGAGCSYEMPDYESTVKALMDGSSPETVKMARRLHA